MLRSTLRGNGRAGVRRDRVRAAFAIFVTVALMAAGGPFATARPPIDPYARTSPSNVFTFEVDPTSYDGRGPSDCRLLSAGKEVWAQRLPFTFHDAVVSDDGSVCGYGPASAPHKGGCSVAILDPMGRILRGHHFEDVRLEPSNCLPWPYVAGINFEPDVDRFALRIQCASYGWASDRREDWGSEVWRCFRISDGTGLPDVWPLKSFTKWLHPRTVRLDAARPLTGTGLTLIQGTVVALIDGEGRPVWTLCNELAVAGTDDREDKRSRDDLFEGHGTILDVAAGGRFSLGLPDLESRLELKVERSRVVDDEWVVSVLARSDYAPPPPPPDVWPFEVGALAEPPPLELSPLAGFELVAEGKRARLSAFTAGIDPGGRFLLYEIQGRRTYVFDAFGRLQFTAERRPRNSRERNSVSRTVHLANDGPTGVLQYSESEDSEVHPFVARVDSKGRSVGDVSIDSAQAIAGTRTPGMFWTAHLSGTTRLELVDAGGKALRTIDRHPDRTWLRWPLAIAADPDGIAFAASGKWLLEIGATDAETRAFEIPQGRPDHPLRLELSASREWVLLWDAQGGDTLLFRRADSTFHSLAQPEVEDSSFAFGFSPDGSELRRIQIPSLTVARFALPKD